ncbi:MAG: hypothetical protein E4G77_03880 [Nitrosopumilus sp.]|jgi:hypothetical protein|nr:MAG: hypothetical protein E4G77_03880 [Nitrosopumilus sp.]HUU47810.1 hypothetical protein [Nitrosopumilaceae archaeon]
MVLTEKSLDDILNYLDSSVTKLAQDTMSSPEFQMDNNTLEQFLSNQYDIRLGNLLQKKHSDVHHLESGTKNKIIQRKNNQINIIMKKFQA